MFKKLYIFTRDYGLSKLLKVLCVLITQTVCAFVGITIVGVMMRLLLSSGQSHAEILGYQFEVDEILVLFIISQVILSFLGVITEFFKARYLSYFSAWLRNDLLHSTMRREYDYFTTQDSSHIQQTIYNYSGQVGHLLGLVLDLVIKGSMVSIFAISALHQAPFLTTMLFLVSLFLYGLIIVFTKKLRRVLNDELKSSDQSMQSLSMQMIQGIKMFRLTRKEKVFEDSYRKATLRYSKYSALAPLLSVFPKYLLEGIMLTLMGAYLLFQQSNSGLNDELPQVGVLVFIAFKVFPLMQGCYSNYSQLSTSGYLVENIYKEYSNKKVISVIEEQIAFDTSLDIKDLTFSYDGAEIKFPDFSIKKGTVVGVVGPSGSGKSTLMDLLLGLHEPRGGCISVDGNKIQASQLRALHKNTGYVGQDPFLLHTSIAQNITLVQDENVDVLKLKKATELAQIANFIEGLPESYDTIVGDRGVRLSGGQRQRIALARALYNEPAILFFDEATSALDTETEKRIMDTIYALPDNLTVVMIAHRVSTLDRVDKLIDVSSIRPS